MRLQLSSECGSLCHWCGVVCQLAGVLEARSLTCLEAETFPHYISVMACQITGIITVCSPACTFRPTTKKCQSKLGGWWRCLVGGVGIRGDIRKIGIQQWISNYMHSFLCDVITHPCPHFIGSLAKLPLKSGHGWVITSCHFMCMCGFWYICMLVWSHTLVVNWQN